MPDRPPPPRDSGDDEATPPRGTSAGPPTTASPDGRDDEWDEEWDEPNYLVRRALVVGAVVVGIALVAIVVGRFIGGDDSSTGDVPDAAEWDSIVVLDEDGVRLIDPESGDEIESYETTGDLLDDQSIVAGPVLVTLNDAGVVVQTDLTDGSQRRGRAGPDETLTISAGNPELAIVGSDSGGDVAIVDTRDRSVTSVAEVAGLEDPLIFADEVLVNPAGTHVAVPVPNAFQSVVIDLEQRTSQARAGRVIAIDDERVVTEQPAGGESELEFFDLAGERLGSVDVPAPRATLLREDGQMLSVSETGVVSTVDADGSIDDVGTLTDPEERPIEITGGIETAQGERLVAIGPRNTYVLDADGEQLAAVAGAPPWLPGAGARCVVAAPSSGTSSSTQPTSVVDLETGTTLVEVERGFASAASYDGCTVAFQGTDLQLLRDGELSDVDADSIAAVAPDGTGTVVIDGRDSEFVALDGEPVEIADGPSVIHFATRS